MIIHYENDSRRIKKKKEKTMEKIMKICVLLYFVEFRNRQEIDRSIINLLIHGAQR